MSVTWDHAPCEGGDVWGIDKKYTTDTCIGKCGKEYVNGMTDAGMDVAELGKVYTAFVRCTTCCVANVKEDTGGKTDEDCLKEFEGLGASENS